MISIRAQLAQARALVAGAFLFGLLSGPLRTCVTHEQHGQHATGGPMALGTVHGAAHGHGWASRGTLTTETPADHAPSTGCDCLGLCHVESAPLGILTSDMRMAVDPARSESLGSTPEEEPSVAPTCTLPFARGPPAVA